MPFYIKKPIPVEAFQFSALVDLSKSDIDKEKYEIQRNVPKWLRDVFDQNKIRFYNDHVEVESLEGTMKGNCDDFLMRGIDNELYICQKDIFYRTYEMMNE